MIRNFSKILFVATLISLSNSTNAAEVNGTPKPGEADYLKILDNFKYYASTKDLEKVSTIDSTYILRDAETIALLKESQNKVMADYEKNKDGKSSDTKALIQSLQDAYNILQKKLEMQNKALIAFEESLKEAQKLVDAEKLEEDKCLKGFENAQKAGSEIKNECGNLEDKDQENCLNELNKCSTKITSDAKKFNAYLDLRETEQASIAGYKAVSKEDKFITANFPKSQTECKGASKDMADAELAGKCLEKVANDEANESYQTPPPKITDLGVNEDLDSSMLIPKHRVEVWNKLKTITSEKVKTTTEELEKIKANIEKLGGVVAGLGAGDAAIAGEDYKKFGINGAMAISAGVLKDYFSKVPPPTLEEIVIDAAKFGLDRWQIAEAMNIGGYGGKPTQDYMNFAKHQERLNEYAALIDPVVKAKGGNFNGPWSRTQIPGVEPIDSTTNVMSNKGLLTPARVKEFLDTNPTDQEFFAKMNSLDLRIADMGAILNGQNLLFKDRNPTQSLLNDKEFGSIFNRLSIELYEGTTGWGVSDTYDINALIVPGTGHIWDEPNNTWRPYGFDPNKVNQWTINQTTAPTKYIPGGRFGLASKAINTTKFIKPQDLKLLTTKPKKKKN